MSDSSAAGGLPRRLRVANGSFEPSEIPGMDVVARFAVVFNHEGQYSVWDDERPMPAGWQREGFVGPRADCLEHIGRVWQDMTPRSLRERVAADAGR